MRVSVLICTYTVELYPDLQEAAESIIGQTYDDIELDLESDGSNTVDDFGDREDTVVTRSRSGRN